MEPESNSSPPLPETFYNAPLNLLLLGYIRPEYDYVSKESLIVDIHTDIAVARRSLAREAYRRFEGAESEEGVWLRGFGWVEETGEVGGVVAEEEEGEGKTS